MLRHLVLLCILIPAAAFAQGAAFPDVPATHESSEAIGYLRTLGLSQGYPDGTFGPDRTINRAEFTKIIVSAKFAPHEVSACKGTVFADVPADAWYLPYACKAQEAKMILGYPDGTFRGDATISFVEASAILVRAFATTNIADGNPWYQPHVVYLANYRVIPQSIPSFTHAITRAQMAEMIHRLTANVTSKPSRTYEEIARGPAIKFERQTVRTTRGTFEVDVLSGDLSRGVKVLTDSATSQNCDRDCPALSLAEYVKRNNATAGMHGTYFCPPDYDWCSDTINSFIYFVYAASSKSFINSEKRSYDNAGGLIVFRGSQAEFFQNPTSFNLDTTITGAMAMWPALVANRQVLPDHPMMDEKMRTGRGPKGGLAVQGSMVYLLLARGATVPDLRDIMVTMGMDYGINLDGGGTSAIYVDGAYKVGPGRKLPNAILLVE